MDVLVQNLQGRREDDTDPGVGSNAKKVEMRLHV